MLYNKSGRIEHRYLSERIENVDITFSYKDEKLLVKCSGFETLGSLGMTITEIVGKMFGGLNKCVFLCA